jgi:hypothetical protein
MLFPKNNTDGNPVSERQHTEKVQFEKPRKEAHKNMAAPSR